MTEQAQRIAIAKWMGLIGTERPTLEQAAARYLLDELHLPDYTRDLNAMHEAEAKLRADQRHGAFSFAHHLWVLCANDTWNVAHATAAQRAEALLRTLGLWTEDAP